MELKLNVKYISGESIIASVRPAAIVAFERQFDLPITSLNEQARFEWLCFLAYAALQPEATFDAFLASLDDVKPDGADKDGDDKEVVDVPLEPASSEA